MVMACVSASVPDAADCQARPLASAALTIGTIMFSGSRFGTSDREPIHALHEIQRSCPNLIVLKVTSFTQHGPTINNKGAFRRLCRSAHSHSIVAGGFPEMS